MAPFTVSGPTSVDVPVQVVFADFGKFPVSPNKTSWVWRFQRGEPLIPYAAVNSIENSYLEVGMARRKEPSFIEKMRRDLEARAAELRPLIDELHEIEAALEALSSNVVSPRTVARRRPPKSSTRTATRPRARRARRPQRFVRIVRANPGITVNGVAKRMGVQASGLYAVANGLVKEGQVKKKGAKLTAA